MYGLILVLYIQTYKTSNKGLQLGTALHDGDKHVTLLFSCYKNHVLQCFKKLWNVYLWDQTCQFNTVHKWKLVFGQSKKMLALQVFKSIPFCLRGQNFVFLSPIDEFLTKMHACTHTQTHTHTHIHTHTHTHIDMCNSFKQECTRIGVWVSVFECVSVCANTHS